VSPSSRWIETWDEKEGEKEKEKRKKKRGKKGVIVLSITLNLINRVRAEGERGKKKEGEKRRREKKKGYSFLYILSVSTKKSLPFARAVRGKEKGKKKKKGKKGKEKRLHTPLHIPPVYVNSLSLPGLRIQCDANPAPT